MRPTIYNQNEYQARYDQMRSDLKRARKAHHAVYSRDAHSYQHMQQDTTQAKVHKDGEGRKVMPMTQEVLVVDCINEASISYGHAMVDAIEDDKGVQFSVKYVAAQSELTKASQFERRKAALEDRFGIQIEPITVAFLGAWDGSENPQNLLTKLVLSEVTDQLGDQAVWFFSGASPQASQGHWSANGHYFTDNKIPFVVRSESSGTAQHESLGPDTWYVGNAHIDRKPESLKPLNMYPFPDMTRLKGLDFVVNDLNAYADKYRDHIEKIKRWEKEKGVGFFLTENGNISIESLLLGE